MKKLTADSVWSMHAGGVCAAEDKHGYTVLVPGLGTFAIDPVCWPNSLRHRGYFASFQNNLGRLAGELYWFLVDVNGSHSFHHRTIFNLRNARQACQAFRAKWAYLEQEPIVADGRLPKRLRKRLRG